MGLSKVTSGHEEYVMAGYNAKKWYKLCKKKFHRQDLPLTFPTLQAHCIKGSSDLPVRSTFLQQKKL